MSEPSPPTSPRADPRAEPSPADDATATRHRGEAHKGSLAARLNWLRAGVLGANDGIISTAGLVIGVAAGVGCFFAATFVKNKLGYDDALDAFGVHGIGGTIGALLTGVFATMAIKGGGVPVGLIDGNPGQVWVQLKSVVLTMLFCGIGTAIILKVIDLIVGLRVSEEVERDGLDLALHGEAVQ